MQISGNKIFSLSTYMAYRRGKIHRNEGNQQQICRDSDRYLFNNSVPQDILNLIKQARTPISDLEAIRELKEIEAKLYQVELGQDQAWAEICISGKPVEILTSPIAPLSYELLKSIIDDIHVKTMQPKNVNSYGAGLKRGEVDHVIRYLVRQGIPVRLPTADELFELNQQRAQNLTTGLSEYVESPDGQNKCVRLFPAKIVDVESDESIGFRLVKTGATYIQNPYLRQLLAA